MLPVARRARVWPGAPYPLGATFDGRGRELRACSAPTPRRSSCACSTPAASASSSGSCCPSTRTRSGTATCRTSARASSTATASTGPTTRGRGHRFNHHKLLLDPYAKQLVGPAALVATRISATASAAGARTSRFDARDNARGMLKCRVVDTAFTWGDDKLLAHARGTRASSTRPICAASPCCTRTCRSTVRGTCAGFSHAGGDRPPEGAGRHRGRVPAGARLRPGPAPGRAQALQLLGLQLDRLLRARAALPRRPATSPSGRPWSAACTTPASR